jgi:hypothetical protein
MAKRKTLNERRLTRKQVAQLLEAGAVPRPDLDAAFLETDVGLRPVRLYELSENRVLRARNKTSET